MKRLIAIIGATALTAVVGVGTAIPSQAASPQEVRPASNEPKPEDVRQHNFEQRSIDVPPEMLEELLTRAIRKNDPSASPEEIEKILAALDDIGKIVAAIEPGDVARVNEGIAKVSAAVANFVATGNPEAARQILCSSGDAAGGSLAILEDVVKLYEKSKNLPQVAEVLKLLDPRTAEGGELFESLPEEMQTPEVKAALVSLAEIGTALNKADKQKVIDLAKDWADAAANCDVQTILELPRLMLRTFEMAQDILNILGDANLGDVGIVLAPNEAAGTPIGEGTEPREPSRQPADDGEQARSVPSTAGQF